MSNLQDFPPPPSLPSIGERNSNIVHEGSANSQDYQKINCKDNLCERKTLTCLENECKPAFVNFEENLVDKLRISWKKHGLVRVFEELKSSGEVHHTLQNISNIIYNGLSFLQQEKGKSFPVKDQYTVSFKQKLQMVCHPHIPRIAIVLKDNSVKIICLNVIRNSEQDILLKDKRIDQVSCLAWRPKSAMSLAVGSSRGILVWLLDPITTSTRPGSNMTRYLQSKDIASDISTVSWCNDGKLLACSCVNSNMFWIWNIVLQASTPIHRVGSSISFLDWSPCGQRLLTANYAPIFRVWETSTWTCEKWSDLKGKCTNACWSTCGSYLLFTVENDSIIYYVHFQSAKIDLDTIDISGSGVALTCADVSKYMWNDDVREVGGCISSMVWDPTNSRLAVTFHGEDGNNQPYIALYHTRISPFLQLIPCGFLRGEEDEIPLQIDFICGYDKGALLAVYWSSDSISLMPLLFNQSLSLPPRHNVPIAESGTMIFNRTVNDVASMIKSQNETALYSTLDG